MLAPWQGCGSYKYLWHYWEIPTKGWGGEHGNLSIFALKVILLNFLGFLWLSTYTSDFNLLRRWKAKSKWSPILTWSLPISGNMPAFGLWKSSKFTTIYTLHHGWVDRGREGHTYYLNGLAGAETVIEAHPMLVVWILSWGQNIGVPWKVRPLINHPGTSLNSDGVAAAQVGVEIRAVALTLIATALEVLVFIEGDLKPNQGKVNGHWKRCTKSQCAHVCVVNILSQQLLEERHPTNSYCRRSAKSQYASVCAGRNVHNWGKNHYSKPQYFYKTITSQVLPIRK